MPLKRKIFFTDRPSGDREKKNLLFLNLITDKKATSRTEISKLTDVNVVSVSNYINSYLKKGMVRERGYDVSSGGRRPELVELNKDWGCVIGIEAGESYVKGIIADITMRIIKKEEKPAKTTLNPAEEISEMALNLIKAAGPDKGRVKKIGVCLSGLNKIDEDASYAIKEEIENKSRIQALLGSGALAAGFGEARLNPEARGIKDILYVYKDTGEAVFIKGDEFYGTSDEKTEYRYLRPWGEGMSISGAARKSGKFKNAAFDAIIEAAISENETASDIIKNSGTNLGVRVAYLINFFEPRLIAIGGGIEKAGGLFLDPLEAMARRCVSHRLSDNMRIVPGSLGEEACVKGAASLAIRETFIEA